MAAETLLGEVFDPVTPDFRTRFFRRGDRLVLRTDRASTGSSGEREWPLAAAGWIHRAITEGFWAGHDPKTTRVEADFGAERLELRRDGTRLDVPERAIEILRALAAAEGRILSRDALIDQVWGADQAIQGRRVDNLMVDLRQAIEPDPAAPRHLLTVHGRGYKLVVVP